MTIAELAGPVLLRVFPTAFAVVMATLLIALLPTAPRILAWLRGPADAHAGHGNDVAHGHAHAHGSAHHAGHGPDHHTGHHAPHHDHEVVHRL